MHQTSDVIVLTAASITLVTALVPLWKWVWRAHLVRHFDAKKDHYNELMEQAKWFEDRAVKLDTFRKQLAYGPPLDRFKLAECISRLDARDAEWVRKVEDTALLTKACEGKQDECQKNAEECRSFADDVARKVLFW